MIREEVRFLGCGFNKAKYAGKMKYCIEHGPDFGIYKLGSRRIKKMVQCKSGIELEIEGKDLLAVAREAQEIVYKYSIIDDGFDEYFLSDMEILKLVRTKGYSESLLVKLGVSYGK